MEVEANLPDRHETPLPGQPPKLVVHAVVGQPGLVGVNARGHGQGELLGHAQGPLQPPLFVDPAHHQHLGEAGLPGAGHHLLAVAQIQHQVAVDLRGFVTLAGDQQHIPIAE